MAVSALDDRSQKLAGNQNGICAVIRIAAKSPDRLLDRAKKLDYLDGKNAREREGTRGGSKQKQVKKEGKRRKTWSVPDYS